MIASRISVFQWNTLITAPKFLIDRMLIAEEFLLLALDDETGKISYSGASSFPFGVVSGLLLDLMFRGRIILKDQRVRIVDKSSMNDPLLDDVLKRIGSQNRQLRLCSWIVQLSLTFRNIYSKGLLSRLTDQGILGREERTRLKIFHSMRHPLVQQTTKDKLLGRLQGIILDKQDAEAHDLALLCLVKECGLISSLFIREYRIVTESRIKELASSNKLEGSIKEYINETSEALSRLLFRPPFKIQREYSPKLFEKRLN
ncbi:MAG: hypothetical protein RBG13Loki_1862 [Promethearchaeota archaeon CR_4]|nr:MAG: hypothetical protein RBG13Loki_1862 [Candidatus Lokiarchaeota archaeon CR_4]